MIHTYKTDWPTYGLSWSQRRDRPFRLAVGSYIESAINKARHHSSFCSLFVV